MSGIEPVGGLIRAARRRRQQRRWTAEVFPTSVGGTLRAPYPSAASPPVTGGEALFGSSPIGEILRVQVANEHHGPGEPLIFDSILRQVGFPEFNSPGVEIELPHTAVYGIEGDFSYQATTHTHEVGSAGSEASEETETHPPFVGGGSVSLLLNGVGIPGLSPIHAGGSVERSLGKTFTLAQEFVAEKGDLLTIVLDHVDGEPTIAGVIEVATKEPLRVFTPPTPLDLPTGITLSTSTGPSAPDPDHELNTRLGAGSIGAEVGMVMVVHVVGHMQFAEIVSITMENDWQLISPILTQYNPDVPGDSYSFVAMKVVDSSMINDVPSPFFYTIITDRWGQQGGIDPTLSANHKRVLLEEGSGVQVLDLQMQVPALPWSTTLATGGSGLLHSIVHARSNGSPTLPTDEVAVDEWETFSLDDQSSAKTRVQREFAPQSTRTVEIVTGTVDDYSISGAVVFAVT